VSTGIAHCLMLLLTSLHEEDPSDGPATNDMDHQDDDA
jgi:hypothetical protein